MCMILEKDGKRHVLLCTNRNSCDHMVILLMVCWLWGNWTLVTITVHQSVWLDMIYIAIPPQLVDFDIRLYLTPLDFSFIQSVLGEDHMYTIYYCLYQRCVLCHCLIINKWPYRMRSKEWKQTANAYWQCSITHIRTMWLLTALYLICESSSLISQAPITEVGTQLLQSGRRIFEMTDELCNIAMRIMWQRWIRKHV